MRNHFVRSWFWCELSSSPLHEVMIISSPESSRFVAYDVQRTYIGAVITNHYNMTYIWSYTNKIKTCTETHRSAPCIYIIYTLFLWCGKWLVNGKKIYWFGSLSGTQQAKQHRLSAFPFSGNTPYLSRPIWKGCSCSGLWWGEKTHLVMRKKQFIHDLPMFYLVDLWLMLEDWWWVMDD